jgi:hypothetical protein
MTAGDPVVTASASGPAARRRRGIAVCSGRQPFECFDRWAQLGYTCDGDRVHPPPGPCQGGLPGGGARRLGRQWIAMS